MPFAEFDLDEDGKKKVVVNTAHVLYAQPNEQDKCNLTMSDKTVVVVRGTLSETLQRLRQAANDGPASPSSP